MIVLDYFQLELFAYLASKVDQMWHLSLPTGDLQPRCIDTPPNQVEVRKTEKIYQICCFHTSAKLIEIQQNCLSKIHILHDLGSHMESNDTLHGSELVPHWVLGPKNWKFGPMGPKIFAQKFLYTKLVRYHDAILWGFEAKIVFGAKRVSNIQIPDFSLSVGQKNQIDFVSSKSSLC